MPLPGFTSITVNEMWFERFDAIYKFHKKNHMLNPGIVSFASFFCEQLDVAIAEKYRMTNFVSKISYVPEKFTKSTLSIKVNKH
jgi:hypothetical protein